MAIFELFSKRQKKMRGEAADVYVYDYIPDELRVQIVHIIRDTIGKDLFDSRANRNYEYIHKTLCKEYGVFSLKANVSNEESIIDCFLMSHDYEECLDIIELCFRVIERKIGHDYNAYQQHTSSSQDPNDAVDELNSRFKESGIGYQYESGELIRVDSQFIHSETVKPVLTLLGNNKEYTGSNEEFLCAHEHYRHKRFKECLNECLKSFESLMKAIHDKHSWSYNKGDTAKRLIDSCFANNLIPQYLQSQFSSIRNLLESGVPTVRNKESGHGQGSEISSVSEHLASYILHLTATNLLFLANCEAEYT